MDFYEILDLPADVLSSTTSEHGFLTLHTLPTKNEPYFELAEACSMTGDQDFIYRGGLLFGRGVSGQVDLL